MFSSSHFFYIVNVKSQSLIGRIQAPKYMNPENIQAKKENLLKLNSEMATGKAAAEQAERSGKWN